MTTNNISNLTYSASTGLFSIPSGTYIITLMLYLTSADYNRFVCFQSGTPLSPGTTGTYATGTNATFLTFQVMALPIGSGQQWLLNWNYTFTTTTSFQIWTSGNVKNSLAGADYLFPAMLQITKIA